MIVSSLTITAPDSSSLVIGPIVSDPETSAPTGYALEDFVADPAPLVVYKQHTPSFPGGLLSSSHDDLREMTITGHILAGTRDAANAARRALTLVCHDPGSNSTSLSLAPELDMPVVQFQGRVETVKFANVGAFTTHFTITFVTGDPYARAITPTVVTADSGTLTVTTLGNVPTYPELTIETSGTVTSCTVTWPTGSLVLSGMSWTTPHRVVIHSKPGFEDISVASYTGGAWGDLTSKINLRAVGSPWPTLSPGDNTVTVAVAGTGAAVTSLAAAWTDGWVA